MLTHRFPYPPVQGDCIRAWNEIEYLARRHEVWLACLDRAAPRAEHLAHVQARCREVAVITARATWCLLRGAVSLLRGRSLSEGYFYDRPFAALLREWHAAVEFDALLAFSPVMAMYSGLVPAQRRVLDMNDVESIKWRKYARWSTPPLRWFYALESRRMARAEASWVRSHQVSLLVNACEQAKLPYELRPRAAVLRTGVELTRYLSVDVTRVPHALRVAFIGSLAYPPNVRAVLWFARHVWPRVQAAIPDARWLIAGNRPARCIRRLSRQPGIRVIGPVPDVRPLLQAARVFVCPVREQIGVQTKLIEAMAAGRAAVVSPQAAAGLEYDDPPPFLIAAAPTEYAAAVVRVLRDETLARALATRARALARAKYAVADQMHALERWLTGAEPAELAVRRSRAVPAELALSPPEAPRAAVGETRTDALLAARRGSGELDR
ncbi:MAG: glycosyltransferase [Planctomycetota bacterium]